MNNHINLSLILFISFLFINCGENQILGSTTYSVEYKITGSVSRVNVTYTNSSGGTSQESNVSVPWSYTFKGYPGDFVYISAQNQGSSGSVTATVNKDGSAFKTSTSSGAYVIASASGSL